MTDKIQKLILDSCTLARLDNSKPKKRDVINLVNELLTLVQGEEFNGIKPEVARTLGDTLGKTLAFFEVPQPSSSLAWLLKLAKDTYAKFYKKAESIKVEGLHTEDDWFASTNGHGIFMARLPNIPKGVYLNINGQQAPISELNSTDNKEMVSQFKPIIEASLPDASYVEVEQVAINGNYACFNNQVNVNLDYYRHILSAKDKFTIKIKGEKDPVWFLSIDRMVLLMPCKP